MGGCVSHMRQCKSIDGPIDGTMENRSHSVDGPIENRSKCARILPISFLLSSYLGPVSMEHNFLPPLEGVSVGLLQPSPLLVFGQDRTKGEGAIAPLQDPEVHNADQCGGRQDLLKGCVCVCVEGNGIRWITLLLVSAFFLVYDRQVLQAPKLSLFQACGVTSNTLRPHAPR